MNMQTKRRNKRIQRNKRQNKRRRLNRGSSHKRPHQQSNIGLQGHSIQNNGNVPKDHSIQITIIAENASNRSKDGIESLIWISASNVALECFERQTRKLRIDDGTIREIRQSGGSREEHRNNDSSGEPGPLEPHACSSNDPASAAHQRAGYACPKQSRAKYDGSGHKDPDMTYQLIDLVDLQHQVLDRFHCSRRASTILRQRLDNTCPRHQCHASLFYLCLDESEELGSHEFQFPFSVERMNANGEKRERLWLFAAAKLRENHMREMRVSAPLDLSIPTYARSSSQKHNDATARETSQRQTVYGHEWPPSYPALTMCLENIWQCGKGWVADLSPLEGINESVLCDIRYLPIERQPRVAPMTLSQWIRGSRDSNFESPLQQMAWRLGRVSLAKQLVKSVLGLSPDLWPQDEPLTHEHIEVIDHEQGKPPEPLLNVCFVQGRSSSSQPDLRPPRIHPGIILRLGVILLELAHQQMMPSLDETYGVVCPISMEGLRAKCVGNKLFDSDAYTGAVMHCLSWNGLANEFFLQNDHQQQFHLKVVIPLPELERDMASKLAELEREIHGKKMQRYEEVL